MNIFDRFSNLTKLQFKFNFRLIWQKNIIKSYFFFKVPAATNALSSGTEMTTDAQGSRVVLTADGSEPDRLSDLVHQVAYLNTREFPSPGKRILKLATTLHCV